MAAVPPSRIADRCAIGIPDDGGWRMLSGDETGWLLGDYILSHPTLEVPPVTSTVASSVVSSRMLASIAAAHGARHVETLTGFKWLARAAGDDLVYAYEEAIGHCVDPAAVRDKDGISAAVLCCDLAATAKAAGRDLRGLLDDLARDHGVHLPSSITERSDDAAGRIQVFHVVTFGQLQHELRQADRRTLENRTDVV